MLMLNGVTEDLQTIVSKGPALISQAARIVIKAGEHLPLILDVVEDPALPQIARRVKILKSLAAGAPSTAVAVSTSKYVPGTGIGLKRAVPILDIAIFYLRNPWVTYAAGAGVVALLGGLGFLIGRRTARR